MKTQPISILLAIFAVLGGGALLFSQTVGPVPPTADVAKALGFEVQGLWLSVPPDLLDQMAASGNTEEDLWCHKERSFQNLTTVPRVTLAELNSGLTLTKNHATEGQWGGRWANHPRFPSLICRTVPMDWGGKDVVTFDVYSDVETREVVTLAVLSDNPITPWKDWYFAQWVVNFRGPAKVVIPVKDFVPSGKPLGWARVGGLGFFSKAFGHHPSPLTTLTLDNFKAETLPGARANHPDAASPVGEIPYFEKFYDKTRWHNHGELELGLKNPVTTRESVLTHESYFLYERAVAQYNPRFQPGYVSFDPKGKAYVMAGDTIQWVGADGKWNTTSVRGALESFGIKKGWQGLRNNDGGSMQEPMIRFDVGGDAYLITQVTEVDPGGTETHWSNRTPLLLHSRDQMKTWDIYVIPGGKLPAFEKLDGHNRDCLLRPPVILNADISYFTGTDPGCYLVVPEKQRGGTLKLTGPYRFGDYSTVGGYHSGDGNQVITLGDRVFVTYTWVPMPLQFPALRDRLSAESKVSPGLWGGGNWDVPHLKGTEAAATLPPIPDGHPAHDMVYRRKGDTADRTAKTGVPAFIRTFDLKTKTFSEPVFLGYGGYSLDGHNWTGITADSTGTLHVVINGHHDPLVVIHSLKPRDISAWSSPAYVAPERAALSYATLTCDRDDYLYTVHRSTSDGLYNNRLGFYRKKPGAEWESERPLVYPFRYMYNVWYQRMSYDRDKDRLFLTYNSRGGQMQLAQDQYEFYIFQFPDQEKQMAANTGDLRKDNTGRIIPLPKPMGKTGGQMYQMTAGELTILVSSDKGETWNLATTEDFK